MSHFTVLVIGDDVEGQLEPYDENTEMEPYRVEDEPDVEGARNYVEQLRKEHADWVASGKPELTADMMKENKEYHRQNNIKRVERGDWTLPTPDAPDAEFVNFYCGEGYEQDDDGTWYRMSTYNPDSKWDWWTIGGRWTGFFTLKPDGEGELGGGGLMTPRPTDPLACDQAKKGDIDFDAMRVKGIEQRKKDWEEYCQALNGHGPWGKAILTALENPDPAEVTRAQDRLRSMFGIRDDDTEDTYVNRWTWSTFAVVKDGEWYEKGKMGWWACVSDEKDENAWQDEFRKLVDGLPDETLLTVVDCHI